MAFTSRSLLCSSQLTSPWWIKSEGSFLENLFGSFMCLCCSLLMAEFEGAESSVKFQWGLIVVVCHFIFLILRLVSHFQASHLPFLGHLTVSQSC